MVGGRREDALPAINTANIFSALESRRRRPSSSGSNSRKKLERSDSSSSSSKKASSPPPPPPPAAPQVWARATVTSWADCEDDDEDYFATAPLPSLATWSASSDQPHSAAPHAHAHELSQGEESEEDGDEEAEEDELDEAEESENGVPESAGTTSKTAPTPVPAPTPREPERQLSKKELKKKGLAELEAVLEELGIAPKDESDGTQAAEDEKTTSENGDSSKGTEAKPMLSESKSSKRRKAKRDKSFKEGRNEEAPITPDTEGAEKDQVEPAEKEGDTAPADRKEVLKKLASMKKKKSGSSDSAAAKAAAAEAAARAAKLAAAKKKEKGHYNQQPVR